VTSRYDVVFDFAYLAGVRIWTPPVLATDRRPWMVDKLFYTVMVEHSYLLSNWVITKHSDQNSLELPYCNLYLDLNNNIKIM